MSLPVSASVRLGRSVSAWSRHLRLITAAVFLATGGLASLLAAPDQVALPAAVGITPGGRPVGPALTGPVTDAIPPNGYLTPNDVIAYDDFIGGVSGGSIVDFNVHNTAGTTFGSGGETFLANSSSSNGTGLPYSSIGNFAVSPASASPLTTSNTGKIYYFYRNGSATVVSLAQIDPSTGFRSVVSDATNAGLGIAPQSINTLAWDYATGTIFYYDARNDGAAGIYRVDPATGLRTAVSLNNNTVGSGVTMIRPTFFVTDPYGNLFFLDDQTTNQGSFNTIVELPVTAAGARTYGARKVISNNTGVGSGVAFIDLVGLWPDNSQAVTLSNGLPGAESLIATEVGNSQTDSALYRVNTSTGVRTKAVAFSASNTVFDFPSTAVVDSSGRIYYQEGHNGGTSNNTLAVVPAGSATAANLSGATNLGAANDRFNPVPFPLPTLAAGTTSNVLGTTATLNGTVSADGGSNVSGAGVVVPNAGILSRGFVYALTSTNNAPKIGGVGVTPVVNTQASTAPVATSAALGTFSNGIGGLTQGASYTFSAYAQDAAGYGYSAPLAFATSIPPTVTTPTATNITGVSATLGGNVTSDGGSAITARGIVYSVTTTNSSPVLGGSGVTNLPDPTAATGVFTDSTGNNLTAGTGYSYKAYATNAIGTAYTTVATFATAARPTANSQSVSVQFNTARAITLTGSDPNTPAQTLTYAVTASPTKGTLSGTAPNLTYTPATGANGSDSFQFTVTNTANLTSTAGTVTLAISAGTPVANSQSVSVQFNTATAVTLTGTDPDVPALTLTYTIVTSPAHGTLSGTAPNLTYTPTANYQGADSFTFTTSNGTNTSNTATVSITVAAGTPTANAQSTTTAFNTAKAITLTGTDPDSPALTLTYTVATAPIHGTLSGTAPNLTYTPAANYQGADSFTFTVSNGQKSSTAATVSITVSAGTPTANAQSVSVQFNTATAVTLTGTDPDVPALTLTYTLVTAPIHGTLSGTAPNLTYTPTSGYQGTDSFTFTVSNGQKTSTAATVSITVSAGTPTANAQSVSVQFNTATAVTLTGTDPDVPALTLTYTLVTAPIHGTLSGTAPNLTYTPTSGYQGTDSFTFRVSNGTNTSNTATVSITVAAGTPTANAQSTITAFNTAKAITLTGTDPDVPALALTYTVATAPIHGTLSGTAPNLTYTPTANYQGADSFTFTVSNGQKTSTAATVSITVSAGTPTANAQSVNAYLNQPRAITLTGTDPDVPALPLTYTVVTAPANGTLSGTAPNLTYTPTPGFAGTDSFTFRVSNGTNTSNTATVSITVFGQPTITGFTASGGVGSTVTLTGTNFTGTTGVTFFRNVLATGFTVVGDTQITVTVPNGATTGTLRVTTPAGTGTTATKFTVTGP